MTRVISQSSNWITCVALDNARMNYTAIFKFQFVFFSSLFILHFSLSAQKVPGYFITNTSDTVKVQFDPPTYPFSNDINFLKLQSKIKYFDSLDKKQSLKPEMTKEFSFEYQGEKIRMISLMEKNNGYGTYNTFMRLKIDGKLKLYYIYEQYYGDSGMGGIRILLKYAVQLDNKPVFRLKEFSFRKDLVEYIMPCPDLKKKIEGKIYDRKDMYNIVTEYNGSCN